MKRVTVGSSAARLECSLPREGHLFSERDHLSQCRVSLDIIQLVQE